MSAHNGESVVRKCLGQLTFAAAKFPAEQEDARLVRLTVAKRRCGVQLRYRFAKSTQREKRTHQISMRHRGVIRMALNLFKHRKGALLYRHRTLMGAQVCMQRREIAQAQSELRVGRAILFFENGARSLLRLDRIARFGLAR